MALVDLWGGELTVYRGCVDGKQVGGIERVGWRHGRRWTRNKSISVPLGHKEIVTSTSRHTWKWTDSNQRSLFVLLLATEPSWFHPSWICQMLFKRVVVIQPGNGNILNRCSKELYLKRTATALLWLLSHVSTVFQKHL